MNCFGACIFKQKLRLNLCVLNRNRQQDLLNLLGATYAAVLFLGATNASAVQSVVGIERTVFYRERAAGMYSELPYAFAQVIMEIIKLVTESVITEE